MSYILSIDQGTTGTTCVLIDAKNFKFIAKSSQEFPQIYPHPSWVEHNLNDIWSSTENTIKKLLRENNIMPNEIISIGITNQRETTCAFTSEGVPLSNAIVWQDRRTQDFCHELKKQNKESWVKEKTGLPIDPYFSATKMHWLLKNHDRVIEHANKNDLRLGTIDTFILYKLTGHQSFATEPTNASRTLLMDLKTGTWDNELCELFSVDQSFLPQINASFSQFGVTQGLSFLPDGIPITGILGDQQAALFGQAGVHHGDIKCTYGTGAFMLANTGNEIKRSEHGLLSTVAYADDKNIYYALEGSCYIAGAAVQWLRDNLTFFSHSHEIEGLAKQIKSIDEMKHVLFLPFFTGLGSPYWESDAKGAIVGLTRDSGKAHIAHACLDGIALSINDLLSSVRQDMQTELNELRVDGGAVANDYLMEIQATVSQTKIIRPVIIETTAYGAALASAVGHGLISTNDIAQLWQFDREFHADKRRIDFYQNKKSQWTRTIRSLFVGQ